MLKLKEQHDLIASERKNVPTSVFLGSALAAAHQYPFPPLSPVDSLSETPT